MTYLLVLVPISLMLLLATIWVASEKDGESDAGEGDECPIPVRAASSIVNKPRGDAPARADIVGEG